MTQQNDYMQEDLVQDAQVVPANNGLSPKAIHSMMRGRYKWAALLFAALAPIGASIGWFALEPVYTSTATIRIKPTLPKVTGSADQTNILPMFDAFLQSQVQIAMSDRVANIAVQHSDWRALKRGITPKEMAKFNESLKAVHPNGTDYIILTFNDKTPEGAFAGVKAVVYAYEQVYRENDVDGGASRIGVLEQRKTKLTNELRGWKERIAALTSELGTSDVSTLVRAKVDRVQEIELEINKLEIAIASADEAAAAQPQGATTQPMTLTPWQMAKADPRLGQLYTERTNRERALASMKRSLGEKNKAVVEAQLDLDVLNQEIAENEEELRKAIEAGNGGLSQAAGNLVKMKAQLERLRTLHERVKSEAQELTQKGQALQQLNDEVMAVNENLSDVKQKLEQLALDGQIAGGRLERISNGDLPLKPTNDKRIPASVGLGMVFGLLGAGLIVLRAITDPKLRHIADAEQPALGAPRVLGVVPALLATEDDPERVMSTAHSVHNVRVQLQMEINPGGSRSIVMTSPAPGSGKTSLTMALGVSFAASGARTLLIDCDLVGGGLTAMTRRINRRRIGRILVQQGIITEEQLTKALDEAVRTGRKVGEVIEESGLADSATIAKALERQASSMQGLRQALRGEDLSHCIVDAGVPGLYVLPLGDMTRHHAGRISPTAIKTLLERAKAEFDTVLVDTGPVLGGLESLMAASLVDGVVVTLSSGEHKPLVHRAFETLHQARVNLVGVVFNRARGYDLMTSTFSSSVVRHSVARLPGPETRTRSRVVETEGVALGPIGSAVATMQDDDEEGA